MCSVGDEILDKSVTKRYMSLPQPCNQIQVSYVWIDGSGERLRSKTRTMDSVPARPTDCLVWSFDGWSTGQSECGSTNSDVLLYPCALFNDPFRRGQNKIALCETYTCSSKKPTPTNFRSSCRKTMEQVRDSRPWFGMEQQFGLYTSDGSAVGWPKLCNLYDTGASYCGVGAAVGIGRDLLESHYRACIYAGVRIAGMHSEANPSQWLFQVGPCEGIEIGDNVWMARFLLQRLAEEYRLAVSFDSRPNPGNWQGNRLFTNFSTLKMRQDGGIKELEKAVERFRVSQPKHLPYYDPNQLTKAPDSKPSSSAGGGAAAASDRASQKSNSSARVPSGSVHSSAAVSAANPTDFSSGIGNRDASIRIPFLVAQEGKGHLQDRRPYSDADPYRVADYMARTTCPVSSASSAPSDSNQPKTE